MLEQVEVLGAEVAADLERADLPLKAQVSATMEDLVVAALPVVISPVAVAVVLVALVEVAAVGHLLVMVDLVDQIPLQAHQ